MVDLVLLPTLKHHLASWSAGQDIANRLYHHKRQHVHLVTDDEKGRAEAAPMRETADGARLARWASDLEANMAGSSGGLIRRMRWLVTGEKSEIESSFVPAGRKCKKSSDANADQTRSRASRRPTFDFARFRRIKSHESLFDEHSSPAAAFQRSRQQTASLPPRMLPEALTAPIAEAAPNYAKPEGRVFEYGTAGVCEILNCDETLA